MQGTPERIDAVSAEAREGESCILELECQSDGHPVWLRVMESEVAPSSRAVEPVVR